MRILRKHLTGATFVLLLGFAPSAFAQDQAAAEALFRSAREAARQGDWVTACDRFEESNRLEPAPGTVLNIARCREKLGQLASAWKSYEEAVQRLPKGDKRIAFAKKQALRLEPLVPWLTLIAPQDEGEFTVTVMGTEFAAASLGVALPFDPGEISILVQSPGREEVKTVLQLEAGDKVEHQIEVGAQLAEEPEEQAELPVAETPDSSGPWPTVAFVAGGLGAGAAIFGGVWAAVEMPKVKEGCINNQCGEAGTAASKRGRAAVTTLAVGSAFAVVGFGLGTYLTLKADDSSVSVLPSPAGALLQYQTNF